MQAILADIGLLLGSALAALFAIIPSVRSRTRTVWILTAVVGVALTLFQYKLIAETGRGVFDHAACTVFSEGRACVAARERLASSAPTIERLRDDVETGARFTECAHCPEMVVLPVNEFLMGSPEDEAGRYHDEGPQRHVQPPEPFAVSRFEITRAQYAEFANATDRPAGASCIGDGPDGRQDMTQLDWRTPGFSQSENDPVVCVSWYDAHDYVLWLNAAAARAANMTDVKLVLASWLDVGAHRPGLINRVRQRIAHRLRDDIRGPYRLPSESEWEYAARAGVRGRFQTGRDIAELCTVANHAAAETSVSWRNTACSDHHRHTAPVGTLRANAFGLNDTEGNVWEWVRDCYETTLDGVMANGRANERTTCPSRAFRGGSWGDEVEAIRFANRSSADPTMRSNRLGFRVVRSLNSIRSANAEW